MVPLSATVPTNLTNWRLTHVVTIPGFGGVASAHRSVARCVVLGNMMTRPIDLEVWVETEATEADVAAVQDAVGREGLSCTTERRIVRESVTDLPWEAYILVSAASPFLANLASASVTEGGRKLRAIVRRVRHARCEVTDREGTVAFGTGLDETVWLPDGLPEIAYIRLIEFLAERGKLPVGFYWDQEVERWRDPLENQ